MNRPDPANYRAMSVPHDSPDAAMEAMHAFLDEVEQVRKKHRIPDVTIVLKAAAFVGDGQEGDYSMSAHFGDPAHKLPMLATAYGGAREQYEAALAAAVRGNKR